ncbi:MAG: hypothetical protein LBF22_01150 [Deltaproteobacteria bacterium]|jgi:hypothetical protein|nr:hypothetical protein [Deltaproteobacteria bacterium]
MIFRKSEVLPQLDALAPGVGFSLHESLVNDSYVSAMYPACIRRRGDLGLCSAVEENLPFWQKISQKTSCLPLPK